MGRPMPVDDLRRGKRERGNCPVCDRDVALTVDGIPQRHRHPTMSGHCLGDSCVGRYKLVSLEAALFLQTDDVWYRFSVLEDLIESRTPEHDLAYLAQLKT